MKEIAFAEQSETSKKSSIIIAAAGKGTRLMSNTPKILYSLAGKTILEWIYSYCSEACREIVLVLSPEGKKYLVPFINKKGYENIKIAVQTNPIGMADAIKVGFKQCSYDNVFVVWGDQPCYSKNTLAFMSSRLANIIECQMIFPALKTYNPYVHYETNNSGMLTEVLERREDDNMPKLGLSDSGLFLLRRSALGNILSRIESMALGKKTNERSFIRLLPALEKDNDSIKYFFTSSESECLGINTQEEAKIVEKYLLNVN